MEKVGRRVEFHIGSGHDTVGFLVRMTSAGMKVQDSPSSLYNLGAFGDDMVRAESDPFRTVLCEFHFDSELLAVREFMTRNYGERTPIQISNSEGRCVWYIDGMSQTLGTVQGDKWITYSVRLRLAPPEEQPKNQIEWGQAVVVAPPNDYAGEIMKNPRWPNFDDRRYTPAEKSKRRGRPTPHQFIGRGDACEICGRIYGDVVHTSFNRTPEPPKPKPAPPAERVFRTVEEDQ